MPTNAAWKRDRCSVLVVEDDFLQQEAIALALARRGLRVLTADNGFAAMHCVRRSWPAVVVLDIDLPGLDGLDVARLIRRLNYHPQLILMSGSAQHLARAHKEDLGVFAIVEKPILFPALARFIHEAMSGENDDDNFWTS